VDLLIESWKNKTKNVVHRRLHCHTLTAMRRGLHNEWHQHSNANLSDYIMISCMPDHVIQLLR